jgi:hypothetical protein
MVYFLTYYYNATGCIPPPLTFILTSKREMPNILLIYTADLPTSSQSTTATFADNTAVVAMDSDPAMLHRNYKPTYLQSKTGLKKWRMKTEESKSIHVRFTTRRETCPPLHINSVQLSQDDDVEYLGLHLDRRLTWHIFHKTEITRKHPHQNVLVTQTKV